MKHNTNEQFELFDFHDSPIEKIFFNKNVINIRLSFANILEGHKLNKNKTAQCIDPCELIFKGVTKTEAVVWDEKKEEFGKHPSPEKPIDGEILKIEHFENENSNTCYIISGFHQAGWSEWKIECSELEVGWNEFSGEAWFVKWPPEK